MKIGSKASATNEKPSKIIQLHAAIDVVFIDVIIQAIRKCISGLKCWTLKMPASKLTQKYAAIYDSCGFYFTFPKCALFFHLRVRVIILDIENVEVKTWNKGGEKNEILTNAYSWVIQRQHIKTNWCYWYAKRLWRDRYFYIFIKRKRFFYWYIVITGSVRSYLMQYAWFYQFEIEMEISATEFKCKAMQGIAVSDTHSNDSRSRKHMSSFFSIGLIKISTKKTTNNW